MIFAQLECHAP